MAESNTFTLSRTALVASVLGVGLAVGVPFVLSGEAPALLLKSTSPAMLTLLAALALVSAFAKAGKFHLLRLHMGERPSFTRSVKISVASDFAFLVSPGGTAGYVLSAALLRRAGNSWSRATSVVAGEQAVDLVFFMLALPLAVLSASEAVVHLMGAVPAGVYELTFIVLALGAATLWLARHRLAAILGVLSHGRPRLQAARQRLRAFFGELCVQMGSLLRGHPERTLAMLLFTAMQWGARYGALWLALCELGHELSFGLLFVLQAVILHAALLTGIPSGGGGADLGLAVALAPWVSAPVIATVLLQWRFATLYFPLIVSALGLAAVAARA